MNYSNYEQHVHADPDFPVIFHYDVLETPSNLFLHWHESIEILYFVQGTGTALCDFNAIHASAGDVVVVNGNELHAIKAVTPRTEYYCLIVDHQIYEEWIPQISTTIFSNFVSGDPKISAMMDRIVEEIENKEPAYQAEVKAAIVSLMVHLTRKHAISDLSLPKNSKKANQIQLVKDALSFMRSNYQHEFSIDELCKAVGFSKYYFCRTFKEVTGKTVIEYLNMLRCQRAQKLMTSGRYNVTQAAEYSGFNNITYFCKVYKKVMGRLPSKEKEIQRSN